jgi:hypothetical protein
VRSARGRRYLCFQALHGLAVDAFAFSTAARLARVSRRTLITPRVPAFEKRTLLGDLADYFQIPLGYEQWTRADALSGVDRVIDVLIRVIPWYRSELRSAVIRDAHPVWVSKIYAPSDYFRRSGFIVKRQVTWNVYDRQRVGRIAAMLSGPEQTVAVSYLNGLVREYGYGSTLEQFAAGPLPCKPTGRITGEVSRAVGSLDLAMHVRRGNLAEVAGAHGRSLPDLERFLALVTEGARVYLATDDSSLRTHWAAVLGTTSLLPVPDGIEAAVRDLYACVCADRFVGTWSSTFSFLIVAARLRYGRSSESATLLH